MFFAVRLFGEWFRELRALGFPASSLKGSGYNPRELLEAGYSVKDLVKVGQHRSSRIRFLLHYCKAYRNPNFFFSNPNDHSYSSTQISAVSTTTKLKAFSLIISSTYSVFSDITQFVFFFSRMITMDEGGYPWKGVARPRLQPW
jgi:hypothetical protein